MQQLSNLNNATNAYPNSIKAIEKSARDSNVKSGEFNLFGDNGLGFEDVLQAMNPLNYIPGVSSLYQSTSGSNVSPIVSLASGALLGGPLGFVISAISTGFELATGDSPIGHALAYLTDDSGSSTTTQMASNAAGAYQKAYRLG